MKRKQTKNKRRNFVHKYMQRLYQPKTFLDRKKSSKRGHRKHKKGDLEHE